MSDFILRPNVLRGAFIEYGLSLPPLLLAFQFNPETLTRGRTATSYAYRGREEQGREPGIPGKGSESMQRSCLAEVDVSEETIGLTLQLDATDDLDDG